MAELTVGYVAGFIALGVFIAQVLCPTMLTFVLAGVLSDSETAATWTAAGRSLQSSYWPEFLRSDSALSHGVSKKVLLTTAWVTLTAALIVVAGVVTPLGLYDKLEPSGRTTPSFEYMNDSSPFGVATAPRSAFPFSRTCSVGHGLLQGPAPCPYSGSEVVFSWNGTDYEWDFPGGYSTEVAPIVREIYSSGTRGTPTTISNYFDIQWRQHTIAVDKYKNNGTAFLIGFYRFVNSKVLSDAIIPIEGLIIDMKVGGIGFRNHTLPTDLKHGAIWTEELLFIGPETSCVDTNLTMDYTVNFNTSKTLDGQLSELWLTDRGGFVNLNQTYPFYDHDNAQANPDLQARAYQAAWLNNVWTMAYLNVTNPNNSPYGKKVFSYLNSAYGKQFELPRDIVPNYKGLLIDYQFGSYLLGSFDSVGGIYDNPFNVTSHNFNSIDLTCSGAGNADIANISNIYVGCGLMRGTGQRVDGGSPFLFEGGSKWSAPLYACASTVKANIKTVSFLLNGTGPALESLVVTDVHDKEYPDNSSMPLWGMEDSGLALDGITPVWGLISAEYSNFPNISVVRKPSFYLIGTSDQFGSSTIAGAQFEYMPGSDFAPAAMNSVYNRESKLSTDLPDYSGSSDLAIYMKWMNFSKKPELAGAIVNLIWSDLAAQGVVGTKGVLGSSNAGLANETVPIAVSPIVREIKFRYLFGIPAFVLAVVILAISLLAAISATTRQSSFAIVRQRLHQSSIGRIFTTFQNPDESNVDMSSKQWSQKMGKTKISLSNADRSLRFPNMTNDEENDTVLTHSEPKTKVSENEEIVTELRPHGDVTADHVDSKPEGCERLTVAPANEEAGR